MKVILLKDVKALGKSGDVVKASDGYARNYLLRRGLAKEATTGNVNELNQKKTVERKKKLEETEEAQKVASELKNKEVKLFTKCGDSGRLFGAITSKDISKALKDQCGIDIDKKKIVTNAIKQLGIYEIEVKIYPAISTKIKLVVESK